MNAKQRTLSILVLVMSLIFSGCGPEQLFGPAFTLTPTLTPTGTSILTATFSLTLSPTVMPTKILTPISTNGIANTTSRPTKTPLPSLQPGQSFVLTQIHMINENIGWGIEATGHLLRTTDGGYTWKDVTPPEVGFFSSVDSMHAWDVVRTDGWMSLVMWHTPDGGQTWQRGVPFIAGGPDWHPIAMQFIDDENGWYLSVDQIGMSHSTSETLVRTTDGGASWIPIQPPESFCISGGMIFINEQDGWISNDCRWNSNAFGGTALQDFINGQDAPSLMRTSDGGNTWTYSLPPSPGVFPPIFTSPDADANALIFCGVTSMDGVSQDAFILQWNCSQGYYPGTSPEVLYAYLTPDGGQTWHSWLSTGNESFVNSATGWRMFTPGNGQLNQLQQTTDGGLTWKTIQKVAWSSVQFDFINDQTGWAIVTGGDAPALIHTNNSGVTWTEIIPAIANR